MRVPTYEFLRRTVFVKNKNYTKYTNRAEGVLGIVSGRLHMTWI